MDDQLMKIRRLEQENADLRRSKELWQDKYAKVLTELNALKRKYNRDIEKAKHGTRMAVM
jgi:molecular chaperone GrpE (heat shock protein)